MTEAGHIATNSDNESWVGELIERGYECGCKMSVIYEIKRFVKELEGCNPKVVVVGVGVGEIAQIEENLRRGHLAVGGSLGLINETTAQRTASAFEDFRRNMIMLHPEDVQVTRNTFHADEKHKSQQGWKNRPKHKR